MRDTYLTFYAMTVNGHTASVHVTSDEAIEHLSDRIAEDDTDTYGIERIDGIWELLKRIGSFEDYDDDWMEDALYMVHSMVDAKRDLIDRERKAEQEKNKETSDPPADSSADSKPKPKDKA